MPEPAPPGLENPVEPQCSQVAGPWPFVTWRVCPLADGTNRIWSSRHHRKWPGFGVAGLQNGTRASRIANKDLWKCLWMPLSLNWWIGSVFAIGSSLFMLGSILSLVPMLASMLSMNSAAVNAVFFAGSIPFTTAAWLQLFQAANANEFPNRTSHLSRRWMLFGWQPHNIGWLSSALQFAGTLMFNISCYDAIWPTLGWQPENLAIWAPDFAGSILFLASGYLAYAETCHAHWAWKPESISWWVVFSNLVGCLAFMASACFAYDPATGVNELYGTVAVAFTLIGAIGFLMGSLLMLLESAIES